MGQPDTPFSPVDGSSIHSGVGIDIGSQSSSFGVCKPDKSLPIKPSMRAHAAAGFAQLDGALERLGVQPAEILIGLQAPSRSGENLSHFLESRG